MHTEEGVCEGGDDDDAVDRMDMRLFRKVLRKPKGDVRISEAMV